MQSVSGQNVSGPINPVVGEECLNGDLPKKYRLPDKFSARVSKALFDRIVTKTVRSEIITVIAMGMWQVTSHPTSPEYTDICKQLVQKFPVLKESQGTGF